jgi:tetratricopeptide (TPR) repeat protein
MNRIRLILTLVFIVVQLALFAQNYKDNLKKGNKFFKEKNYEEAIKNFHKAIDHKEGNVHATYKLGVAYLFSTEKTKALSYLETVHKISPNIDREIDYHLGLAYQYHYQYKEAKSIFERYKTKNKRETRVDHRISECIVGDSLLNHPTGATITNLSATVNSRWNDYTPLIIADGNTLFFTSNRSGSTGGIRLKDGSYYEDIYSTHLENGLWTKPVSVSKKINTKYHDAAASASPDGKTLFIYSEKGYGDILVSNYENDDWTIPVSLGDKINSSYWETSATVTSDGKTLYFTSDRPGGYGGLDIYKSELQENGTWGMPKNLGFPINTFGNEDSPVIHPDGKSLYFSSNGHLEWEETTFFIVNWWMVNSLCPRTWDIQLIQYLTITILLFRMTENMPTILL